MLIHVSRGALVLAVLVAWQVSASQSRLIFLLFSSPTHVAEVLGAWSTSADRWHDVAATLGAATLSYLVGSIIAAAFTLCLWTAPALSQFFAPFTAALNALPKVVLAPLFILWFGIGIPGRIAFVTSTIFFVILYNVLSSARSVDPLYLTNATALGANRLWLFREVYLPATFGFIMTSLRISAGWALLATLLAEYLGANIGIGYRIAQGQELLHSDEVFAGLTIIGIVAILMDQGLVTVERRFSQWRLV